MKPSDWAFRHASDQGMLHAVGCEVLYQIPYLKDLQLGKLFLAPEWLSLLSHAPCKQQSHLQNLLCHTLPACESHARKDI